MAVRPSQQAHRANNTKRRPPIRFSYEGTPLSVMLRFAPYRHWQRIFQLFLFAHRCAYAFVISKRCASRKSGLMPSEKAKNIMYCTAAVHGLLDCTKHGQNFPNATKWRTDGGSDVCRAIRPCSGEGHWAAGSKAELQGVRPEPSQCGIVEKYCIKSVSCIIYLKLIHDFRACSNLLPMGLPQPVHASQPVPACCAPLFPETISLVTPLPESEP